MAPRDEYRVALTEITGALQWDVGQAWQVHETAKRLKLDVSDDWASRPSVRPEDARRVFDHLTAHPPLDPHVAAAQAAPQGAWTLPPIMDKDGKLIPALERPGEPADPKTAALLNSVW